MMIQIAREFGLHVITTSSSRERADFCTSLGARVAIVRSSECFVEVVKESTLGSGVDLVVDCIGGPSVNDNLQVLKVGGRYVLLASDAGPGKVDLQKVIDKRITLTGASLRSREASFRRSLVNEVKEKVWPLLESKTILPTIHQVLKMSEAPKAIKLIEQGDVMGKVVCAGLFFLVRSAH